MMLLGDESIAQENSSKSEGFSTAESVGSYGNKDARWMKQNGITESAINEIFHKDGDGVEVIAGEVPGNGKRGKSRNCYLLEGLRALLEKDNPQFPDASAVSLCKNMGCYDSKNHTKVRVSLANNVAGSKEKGFTLSAPGLQAAAELIKGMAN